MTTERSLQVSEDKPQIRSSWTVRVSFNEIRGVLNTPPPDLPSPALFQLSSPCPHTPGCARCPAPLSAPAQGSGRRAAESGRGCLQTGTHPLPAGGGLGAGRRRAALPSLPSLLPPSPLLRRRCGRGVPPSLRRTPRGVARSSAVQRGAVPAMGLRAAGLIGCCCLLPLVLPAAPGKADGGKRWTGAAERGEQRPLGVCRGERRREGRRVGKVWGVWRGREESGGGSPAAPRGQSRAGSGRDAGGLEGAFPLQATERISCAICVGCE